MHLKLLNHTSDIGPLENEKLTFVNQNDVKVKGRGHFFKSHTKSFDIIFTWSNAEKALYQSYRTYRNKNVVNIKHDKMEWPLIVSKQLLY